MRTKFLPKIALLALMSGVGMGLYAQSPGGITTDPAVWYRPDNATSLQWKDATANALDLNVATNGSITINPGDARHNFHSWTSGYSAANYYRYDAATNPVFGVWADGGGTTTASTDYSGGFYYMPLTIFGAARPTTGANGEITGIDNEINNGAEPGLGVNFTGGNLYPRFYRAGNGIDKTASTMNVAIGQTSVFMSHPFPGSSTSAAGDLLIGLNGKDTIIANQSGRSSVAGPSLKIGYSGWAFGAFPGDIQEVVWYKASLPAADVQKVNTYLALKYGTTLVQNYVNAAGNTIFDLNTNAGYVSNIAGIGVESTNGGLDQRQSNSVNNGRQVLISTVGLANTNADNAVSLSDGQYLVWGDNGLTKAPVISETNISGTNYRFASVWRVQNTGNVGTVRIAWPAQFATIKLVQSSDPTFASGNTVTDMTGNTQVVNGVTYNYADVTLADGQYFTFAAKVYAPGGIATLPAVWYQPNNATPNKWYDASINRLDLSNATAESGTVNAGDQKHNFNQWTTDYSNTSYYNFLDSSAVNFNSGVNPVFGNYNTDGGYSYMPISIFGVARQTATGNGLISGIDNDLAYGAEAGLGNNGTSPRFYRFGNGIDKTSTSLTATLGQTSLYYAHPFPGDATSGSGNFVIGLDGYDSTITNQNGRSSVAGPYLKIGYDAFTFGVFKGDIQEVVWYKASLTAAEKLQVDTYLALKYGTTLAHDYVDASGNKIYDLSVADSFYRHNVAGIGREDNNGNLDQRQSNSVNTGNQLLISTTGLANTNEANSVSLAEGQYLVWGDNGLAKAASLYTGNAFPTVNIRFNAIWRVQNTAGVGTVRVAWPAGLNHLALIQSADTTFDASDVVTDMSANTQVVNGVMYNYADVTLVDGQYFTLAAKIEHAPGGVFNGLSQWFRADKQTTITGGGDATLTSWTDYAMGIEASQISTAELPKLYNGDGSYFNFNPGINFTRNDQKIGNINIRTLASLNYDIFSLTKEGSVAGTYFNVGMDNTTLNGSNWDQPGLWSNGTVTRRTNTGGIGYFAGTLPAFATNSSSIMYFNFNDASFSKGLNGAANGATYTHPAIGPVTGGFMFGTNSGPGTLGDDAGFIGNIGELIVYGAGNITPEERNRVDAYLAIKYGITLDNVESYVTSASVTVWDKDADKGFYNNVAGIGRDDLSDLYQKQSRSQITNNTNGQLTVGRGDIFATNVENTSTLNNGQFLVWGDNGNKQAMTNATATYVEFTFKGSVVRRMNRIWKAQSTSADTRAKLSFPVASVGTTTFPSEPSGQYVIIFASDSAITTDISVVALTEDGVDYTVAHTFPNGAEYFTFGKINDAMALPVTFADFTARKDGNSVLLNWSTLSEQDSKGFQVERSIDNTTWKSLGFVPSKAENGNSQVTLTYTYTDNLPPADAKILYRLKLISNSGNISYSDIASVSVAEGQAIMVYPNPVSNVLNIANLGNGNKNIHVYTVNGSAVYQVRTTSTHISIDVSGWNSGIYTVSVTNGRGETSTYKVLVK